MANLMITHGDFHLLTGSPLDMLRQQMPFRYVDEVTHFDGEQCRLQGCLALSASDLRTRYGADEAGSLPYFLVFEALAQLSGVLIRYLSLVTTGQVGYLISVSESSLMQDRYPPVNLLLQTQLTKQIAGMLQFTCSVTGAGLPEGNFKLEIGVR